MSYFNLRFNLRKIGGVPEWVISKPEGLILEEKSYRVVFRSTNERNLSYLSMGPKDLLIIT